MNLKLVYHFDDVGDFLPKRDLASWVMCGVFSASTAIDLRADTRIIGRDTQLRHGLVALETGKEAYRILSICSEIGRRSQLFSS